MLCTARFGKKARAKRAQDWADDLENFERQAEIAALAAEDRKRERLRRSDCVDRRIHNETTRKVTFAVNGSLITVEKEPGYPLYENESKARRGRINGYSNRSRQRMIESISGLRADALPLFVTLTYPNWWPPSWSAWKTHLDIFAKRLTRKFPRSSFLWKLEPQERGAPHFHLLIFGLKFIPHEWIAKAWFEAVGSNDESHLGAGTSIERARSVHGVQSYMSKKYLGKRVIIPEGWDYVGRYWGFRGRKFLPVAQTFTAGITLKQAYKFRRFARKYLASRYPGLKKTRRHRGHIAGRIAIFSQQSLQWVRLLDYCCGQSIRPLLLDGTFGPLPPEQPF